MPRGPRTGALCPAPPRCSRFAQSPHRRQTGAPHCSQPAQSPHRRQTGAPHCSQPARPHHRWQTDARPAERAVIFFGWVFFLINISLGSPHVLLAHMWALNTRGEPNEIELTAAHGLFYRSAHRRPRRQLDFVGVGNLGVLGRVSCQEHLGCCTVQRAHADPVVPFGAGSRCRVCRARCQSAQVLRHIAVVAPARRSAGREGKGREGKGRKGKGRTE